MGHGDDYRTVTFKLLKIRVNSILVEIRHRPGEHSIPRSLLHGGDDLGIIKHQFDLPKEVTVRLMSWKADNLGLS